MVAIIDTKTTTTERELLLALKSRQIGRPELRTLAGFYTSSADQKAKALKRAPDMPEQFESSDKWIHSYAHSRGFTEGVEFALRALCGPEAVEAFQQYCTPETK